MPFDSSLNRWSNKSYLLVLLGGSGVTYYSCQECNFSFVNDKWDKSKIEKAHWLKFPDGSSVNA